jgi:hypothetical protein
MTLTWYNLHRFELSSASYCFLLIRICIIPILFLRSVAYKHLNPGTSSLYLFQIGASHFHFQHLSVLSVEPTTYLLSQLHFQLPHLLQPRTIPTFPSRRRQSLYHPFQVLKALLSNRMKHSKQPAKQEKKPEHAPLQSSLYFIQSHNSNRTGGAEAARTRGNHR